MSVRGYLKNLFPPPLRYGREFKKTWKLINASLSWTREEIDRWQFQQVCSLVAYAYHHTKYYHELLDSIGLHPEKMRTWGDFRSIPTLEKHVLQERLPDLLSDAVPEEDLAYITTGGSTGVPVGFYIQKSKEGFRQAHEWFHWNVIGHRFGDRVAILRGIVLDGDICRYMPDLKAMVFSSYNLQDELIPDYIKKLKEYDPQVLRAYPSALDIIARFASEKSIQLHIPSLRLISTTSESLSDAQKRRIESAFSTTVYDKYGNCEHTGLFGMGSRAKLYHDYITYGVSETIDSAGNAAFTGNGEVIGTSFSNFATPIIRYRTNDFIIRSEEKPEFGERCNLPTIERILGRKQEMFVAKGGNLVSMTAMNFHDDIFDSVRQFRFIQKEPGKLTLAIVRRYQFSNNDEQKILERIHEKIGGIASIELNYVTEIPLTKSGKSLFLDQQLDLSCFHWTGDEEAMSAES